MNSPLILLAAGVTATLLCAAMVRGVRHAAAGVRGRIARLADEELADAFIFIDARGLLRISAVAVAAGVGASLFLGLGLSGAAVLCGAAVFTPRLFVHVLRTARQRRLLRQLPDATQALASLFRAGHSMPQALARLADTQPRPLRDEWRLLLRGLRMGERPEAVFERLAERVNAPEARLLATTVRVAVELGGSVAEALEHLAEATRRRLDMQERIRALTAQGRLQGLIVGLLPLLVLAALLLLDPAAMSLLWTTPAGWAALLLVACLEFCGFLLIRRIVRIDV